MPHVIIEYSANVAEHHDVDAFVAAVHDAVIATGIAPTPGVRTRAVRLTDYRIGDAAPANAMIAMVARLGPGRDADAKLTFITRVLDVAEAHIAAESAALDIAWSLEVQEIDAEFRVNRNHVATAMAARTQEA